jgi:hypothetical protein
LASNDWQGRGRKRSWPNLRNYTIICLKKLGKKPQKEWRNRVKARKTSVGIIGVPAGIRIGHFTNYKSEALLLQPICSVVEIKINVHIAKYMS